LRDVIRSRAAAAGTRTDRGEEVRMTQPAKSQEPSMEEILASIRRIIADDDASKTAQVAVEPAPRPAAPPVRAFTPAPPEPAAAPEEEPAAPAAAGGDMEDNAADILDLTKSMAAPSFNQAAPSPTPGPTPQFRKIEAFSDVSFDEAEQKPAMQPEPPERSAREGGEQRLLSTATSAAVDSAFNTLAQTVLVQNARTLEDLVREMLRPLLKSWLDDNLPGMVERLVRAEIERVARGR
jgi:cell pole-organizing protein PopZ